MEKLRILEVSLSRQGKPATDLAAPLIAELNPSYPAKTISLNRELCQILLALDAPKTIDRTLQLLAAAPTQEEQLNYTVALRTIANGWTPDLRRQYFTWWTIKRNARTEHPDYLLRWLHRRPAANTATAPASNNFLVKVRRAAISNVPQTELGRPVQVARILDSWAEAAPKIESDLKKKVPSAAGLMKIGGRFRRPDLDHVRTWPQFRVQGQDAMLRQTSMPGCTSAWAT